MLARPHSKTPAPSPPGGRVFTLRGRPSACPAFSFVRTSADYAINLARVGIGGAALRGRSGETRRRRELDGRVDGHYDGRLFDAGGVAKLPGGKVRGAAAVADVYQAVYDLVLRLRARTGIVFDPHWYRHGAATRWLRDGVPIEVVSALLGHSSVAVTSSVYGHLTVEDARAALEKAGWFTGKDVAW